MQPSIDLFGLVIDEPVTTATDLVLAALYLFCWKKLSVLSPKTSFLGWVRGHFLAMAVSTFFGGVCGHGLLRFGDFNLMKMTGWLPGMLAAALLARAAAELLAGLVQPSFLKKMQWLPWLVLAPPVTAMLVLPDFLWVKINGFLQVIGIVLPVAVFLFREKRVEGSRWFFWAIGLSAVASFVFSHKISPHIWFNHLDLSHCFLMGAAFCYYKGAKWFATNSI